MVIRRLSSIIFTDQWIASPPDIKIGDHRGVFSLA